MKTERRHELQTNKLADWTGSHLEQLRPHGKVILGTAILGAAVIIAAMVIISDRNSAQALAMNDYFLALSSRDRDALANVVKTHAGSWVAMWAKQSQADLDLSNGVRALYTNRDEASRSLQEADKAFLDVVQRGSSYPELVRHSLLGLGQVHEANGNVEKARDYYQKVINQFSGSPEAIQAAEALELLKDPQITSFYNWFARQTPKPISSMMPNFPGMPDDIGKLPERPDAPLLPFPNVTTPPAGPPSDSATPPKSEEPSPSTRPTVPGQDTQPTRDPATAPVSPTNVPEAKPEPAKPGAAQPGAGSPESSGTASSASAPATPAGAPGKTTPNNGSPN